MFSVDSLLCAGEQKEVLPSDDQKQVAALLSPQSDDDVETVVDPDPHSALEATLSTVDAAADDPPALERSDLDGRPEESSHLEALRDTWVGRLDRRTALQYAKQESDSAIANPFRCKLCREFDIYAPHLNKRVGCTCDAPYAPSPALQNEGVDCSMTWPCAMCTPVILEGVASCNDCRELSSDHDHASNCFNCLLNVVEKSQGMHRATKTTALIVGMVSSPYLEPLPAAGAAADHLAPLASAFTTPTNPLRHDGPSVVAGHIDLSFSPRLSPTGFGSETEDEGEVEEPNARSSQRVLTPTSIDALDGEGTTGEGRPRRLTRAEANRRKRKHSAPPPLSPRIPVYNAGRTPSHSPERVPRFFNRRIEMPGFEYVSGRSPSPTLPVVPRASVNYIAPVQCNQPAPVFGFGVVNLQRQHQSNMDRLARQTLNLKRNTLQLRREALWEELRDIEKTDYDLRKSEVKRLRHEIERLQRD